MRSIKRGRGQSAMGAFGSLYSVIFGIIWTIFAFWIGGNFPFPISILFPLSGVFFVAYGIAQTVYQFNNATRKDRFSEFDIVEGEEEPDPLNRRFGRQPRTFNTAPNQGRQIEGSFCPYCRANLQSDFEFCPKCGADI